LRWRAEPAGGTTISFTASLTGSGNLTAGFDEAPWPSGLGLPVPNGYPLWPARLSIGDWAYDYSGVANTASVRAALDNHVAKKTLLILLLHDIVTGSGSNRVAHVAPWRLSAAWLQSEWLCIPRSGLYRGTCDHIL
jgi:hypothetical protein